MVSWQIENYKGKNGFHTLMYIKIIIKHEFFKNNLNFIYALIGQR